MRNLVKFEKAMVTLLEKGNLIPMDTSRKNYPTSLYFLNEVLFRTGRNIDKISEIQEDGIFISKASENFLHKVCSDKDLKREDDAKFVISYILPVLFHAGIDINAKDINGHTALVRACNSVGENIAKEMLALGLIKWGADIQIEDSFNISQLGHNYASMHPFNTACLNGMRSVVTAMLSEGININDEKYTINYGLRNAIQSGHDDISDMIYKERVRRKVVYDSASRDNCIPKPKTKRF